MMHTLGMAQTMNSFAKGYARSLATRCAATRLHSEVSLLPDENQLPGGACCPPGKVPTAARWSESRAHSLQEVSLQPHSS